MKAKLNLNENEETVFSLFLPHFRKHLFPFCSSSKKQKRQALNAANPRKENIKLRKQGSLSLRVFTSQVMKSECLSSIKLNLDFF
jgi:hypothetical protein